jgi:hypothetical protein
MATSRAEDLSFIALLPAFHRFPKEAAIIGRLLAGYGEIEYLFAMCLASSASDEDTALRTFFSVNGEAPRLDVGHNLMWKLYEIADLSNRYTPVRAATLFCRTARNTFSHCHWADDPVAGLFYANLEATAERKTAPFRQAHKWLHVDATLLTQIENYFWNTSERLQWLAAEYRVYNRKVRKNIFRWPKGLSQPTQHNRPETHVPPWQLEDVRVNEEGPLEKP